MSPASCLLSHVSCLTSPFSRLLSPDSCNVFCLTSHVLHLLSHVSCIMYHIICLTSPVSGAPTTYSSSSSFSSSYSYLKNQNTIKAKIVLGSHKNNIFYSRVGEGEGASQKNGSSSIKNPRLLVASASDLPSQSGSEMRRNWCELASFYFRATATASFMFTFAPPPLAPPFLVHANGAVAQWA